MTDSESYEEGAGEYRELFVSITGESGVTEQQDDDTRRGVVDVTAETSEFQVAKSREAFRDVISDPEPN